MGIFSGANPNGHKNSSGGEREDIPFFKEGQRHLRIRKSLLRKGSNKGNSGTYKQWMIITEFDVIDTLSGEPMSSGKTIEVLQRDVDQDLTARGKNSLARTQSLVAAACGLDQVGEDVLEKLWPVPEDGKFGEAEALSGLEVIGVTTSFTTDKGTFTPTTFEPID